MPPPTFFGQGATNQGIKGQGERLEAKVLFGFPQLPQSRLFQKVISNPRERERKTAGDQSVECSTASGPRPPFLPPSSTYCWASWCEWDEVERSFLLGAQTVEREKSEAAKRRDLPIARNSLTLFHCPPKAAFSALWAFNECSSNRQIPSLFLSSPGIFCSCSLHSFSSFLLPSPAQSLPLPLLPHSSPFEAKEERRI